MFGNHNLGFFKVPGQTFVTGEVVTDGIFRLRGKSCATAQEFEGFVQIAFILKQNPEVIDARERIWMIRT